MRQCGAHYKLIMVGDALMAPYELHMGGHWSAGGPDAISGLGWLRILRDHFTDAVWLNPEPGLGWRGTTIEDIGEVMPMFPLTVDGLTEGMALLNRGVPALTSVVEAPGPASSRTYGVQSPAPPGPAATAASWLVPITSRSRPIGLDHDHRPYLTSRTCADSRSSRRRTGSPRHASCVRSRVDPPLDIGADTTTRSSPIPATRSRLWIDHIPPSTCRGRR